MKVAAARGGCTAVESFARSRHVLTSRALRHDGGAVAGPSDRARAVPAFRPPRRRTAARGTNAPSRPAALPRRVPANCVRLLNAGAARASAPRRARGSAKAAACEMQMTWDVGHVDGQCNFKRGLPTRHKRESSEVISLCVTYAYKCLQDYERTQLKIGPFEINDNKIVRQSLF